MAGWYNNLWGYRVKLTIQNAKVAGDLTDYPIYIALADLPAGFHSSVGTNGADIRLTKADGTTELAREVVEYNAASDSGEVHVKYDGTLSGSSDTEIYLYYGNASASDLAVSATYGRNNVWTGYECVYHMNEASNSTITDSTGNGHNSTANDMDQTTTCVVGNKAYNCSTSVDMDGADIGDDDDLSFGTTITVSAWARLTSNSNVYNRIACKWDSVGTREYFLGRFDDSGSRKIYFETYDESTTTISSAISNDAPSVDTWYLYHGVMDAVSNRLYVNASVQNTTGSSLEMENQAGSLRLGRWANNGQDWYGQLDEIRIAPDAKSANWITTEHNNQSDTSSFYSVGDQEIRQSWSIFGGDEGLVG